MMSGCGFFSSGGGRYSPPPPPPPPNTCIVTAPDAPESDKGAVIKAASDLSAFGKLPVKANFEFTLKNKITESFQDVSDENAKCQMLTQLAACYQGIESRKMVFTELRASGACDK